MKTKLILILLLTLAMFGCNLSATGQAPVSDSPEPAATATSLPATATFTASPPPTETFTPLPTFTETSTPAPTATSTPTLMPTVDSLKAVVNAGKLSCRYGPGAEYLFLYGLRQTANIKLIGRTEGNNWVWVDGENKCWVNAKFLTIDGDPQMLPVVYPDTALLPVSPYYPGPSWVNATRNGTQVQVSWEPVPISPGKFADANMKQYLLEVWRCEAGEIVFETLGTNLPFIVVPNDEAGCAVPSRARILLQEKHGYGGPLEVEWPQP